MSSGDTARTPSFSPSAAAEATAANMSHNIMASQRKSGARGVH
jgi:hypothetical protein